MHSEIVFCPFCKSNRFRKYGKRKQEQRYQCSNCKRIFIKSTKTIFSSTKLDKDTLRKLIILILDDTKIKAICDVLSISNRTAYMWRMKIFKEAGEIVKNIRLSGKVWIDEKLIKVCKKEIITKNNGLKFRGQSRNQIIVTCAIDNLGNKYAEIVGKGHISSNQCLKTYGTHIEKGSYIIHDGIFSHDKLIDYLESKDEVWKSNSKISLKHMQPINAFCSEIERNLVIHLGTRKENLQDYLNWIVFRSMLNNENINKKIEELEERCFKNKVVYRIKDRYYRKKVSTFL